MSQGVLNNILSNLTQLSRFISLYPLFSKMLFNFCILSSDIPRLFNFISVIITGLRLWRNSLIAYFWRISSQFMLQLTFLVMVGYNIDNMRGCSRRSKAVYLCCYIYSNLKRGIISLYFDVCFASSVEERTSSLCLLSSCFILLIFAPTFLGSNPYLLAVITSFTSLLTS